MSYHSKLNSKKEEVEQEEEVKEEEEEEEKHWIHDFWSYGCTQWIIWQAKASS